MKKIVPCLWFDRNALEAVKFYVSVFKKGSKIGRISRYGKEGFEFHGMPAGTVLTVDFTLRGQPYTALNGGPQFKFNEAVSFQIFCDTQKEIDYFWDRLTAGGEESQCGWLKDKYGLSWQVSPSILAKLMSDPVKSERIMKALMPMKKLDLAALKKAAKGK